FLPPPSPPPTPPLSPYPTLFRSAPLPRHGELRRRHLPPPAGGLWRCTGAHRREPADRSRRSRGAAGRERFGQVHPDAHPAGNHRSEEHTSELQSRFDLVCRLLLE